MPSGSRGRGATRPRGAMGIKFHCPKGHKLNVKAFLAGKKGVCPKCGAKVMIPTVSEGGEEDSELDEHDPTAARGDHGGNGAAAAALHVAPKLTPVATGPADPISEAPTAVWYVRPPNGMQYGPARGDVMRQWLLEGRVSGDSLVWREGWPDWRAAAQLFPELQSPSELVAASMPVVAAQPATTARLRNQAPAPAPKRSNWLLIALIGLGLLCVALGGALVFVWLGR